MMYRIKNLFLLAVVFVTCTSASALDIVTQDGATGAISFTPSALVNEILHGLIMSVCVGASIFLIHYVVRVLLTYDRAARYGHSYRRQRKEDKVIERWIKRGHY